MTTVQEIADFLERFAPARLAEEWDNVGLLVGDIHHPVLRVMTCLTVTPQSAAEAIDERADLIVSHHPLPFRPLTRITSETVPGDLLLRLIAARVAIVSPHTAFDSAARGINQQLADGLDLEEVYPLIEAEAGEKAVPALGSGRWGRLPVAQQLSKVAQSLKSFLKVEHLHVVGDLDRRISTVGVACGSAGQFLPDARAKGCDLLITGETNFHTCLEASATGMSLLLTGHYYSERFAVEQLAEEVRQEFQGLEVWPSHQECDPVVWL